MKGKRKVTHRARGEQEPEAEVQPPNATQQYTCHATEQAITREVTHTHKLTFGHADDTGVGTNHEHGKVRRMPCQPKHGRLEVLFVTSKINKSQHLWCGDAGKKVKQW